MEITWLAIIETLVAMAIYVGIGLYWNTVNHIFAAVIVAPFMLFRTDQSARLGLDWYSFVARSVRPFTDWITHSLSDALGLFAMAWFAACTAIPVRIASTLVSLMAKPLYALREVPRNWCRQVLCLDLLHPPEFVPGTEVSKRIGGPARTLRVWSLRPSVLFGNRKRSLLLWVTGFILVSPLVLIALLSLAYRWSFKATSLVYGSFIWTIHSTLREPPSLKDKLKGIKDGGLEKLKRKWFLLVLGLGITKLLVLLKWLPLAELTEKIPGQKILDLYVIPGAFAPWQYALILNAALTMALFFFADEALRQLEGEHKSWPDRLITGILQGTTFTRRVLANYTVFCLFYITAIEALHLDWPRLGTNLLPFFGS